MYAQSFKEEAKTARTCINFVAKEAGSEWTQEQAKVSPTNTHTYLCSYVYKDCINLDNAYRERVREQQR